MRPRQLRICGTPDEVAREAAEHFAVAAEQAIAGHGRFAVALSGGSTPRRLYALLAELPYRQTLDWNRVQVFFADERFVPADHPDSNLRLARETLLDRVPLPPANIHPMPTEGAGPEACARRHAEHLAAFFAAPLPRFDLILLGLGPDGHTASLFPGRPDHPGCVAAVRDSPKPPPVRLTLTLEAINRADRVLFLVTGPDKAEPLRTIFEGGAVGASLPAARVAPANGSVLWLADRDAGMEAEPFAANVP